MTNGTANNHNNNTDHSLNYLIPLFFLVFLLLFLLFYCLKSGLLQRFLARLEICPTVLTSAREPLLDEESAVEWRRVRGEILVKRCDQSSTREIENPIIDRLKREYSSRVKFWNRDQDVGQMLVIVFCVNSSRIGTDIENAMRGVHGNSRVVLVLLHSVLKYLLRGDLSDDEELLDPTTRNRMKGIAHFAFSDREGLYDCHQNRVGFDQLLDVVNSLV